MDYVIGFLVITTMIALGVIFAQKVKVSIDRGDKFMILFCSALTGVSIVHVLTQALLFIFELFK